MKTSEIKNHIVKLGFILGKEKNTSLSSLDVKNNGKYASEMKVKKIVKKGVVVKKERGMDMIVIDCMPMFSNEFNYEEVKKIAKKINDYFAIKGVNTEYYNGTRLYLIW